MSDNVPSHFKTFGPLGEQRIARGNDIRISHGVDLVEAANHQRAKLCPRWTPLVVAKKQIKTAPPPGGITEDWKGIYADGIAFARIAWTTYKPQEGRLTHTFHFDFEEGQVRFRVKPNLGVWSAWTTSVTQATRDVWSALSYTFSDTSVHEIEIEFRALADPLPKGQLFAAALVENEGTI